MTTNEIGAVLQMVTDQLARGVEQATPVAQDFLHQYCARELFYGISSLIVALVCSAICKYGLKLCHGDSDGSVEGGIPIVIFSGTGACAAVLIGILHIGCYLSPLPSLLGK